MIDIGGPSMLRAAREELRARRARLQPRRLRRRCSTSCASTGELSLETRRRLAGETFATTAAYEAAIANWFADPEALPDRARCPASTKELELAYGENPHQRRGLLRRSAARDGTCSRASSSCTAASSRSTT